MSKLVRAVIGANYGDEGKGLMTDMLAGPPKSLVIRFNGGAQAGHTVVTPEGKRHVFSHFGSGTLRGADTYLSEHFIVNPMLWGREWLALDKPKLHGHFLARLTTPYDMLINQATNRTNTCGVGINETVTRCESEFATHVEHLSEPKLLRYLLKQIREEWVPMRCAALGIDIPHKDHPSALDAWDTTYLYQCEVLRQHYEVKIDFDTYDNIIFEGAQGLLLDEDHPNFPYVTRSKTGLHNVREICNIMRWKLDEVIYMTRAYMTRHGAGPFPTELVGLQFEDNTNVPNEYQGTLRFGWLDVAALGNRVVNDAEDAPFSVCVTHMDQVVGLPGVEEYLFNDRGDGIFSWNTGNTYLSYGPTREDLTT